MNIQGLITGALNHKVLLSVAAPILGLGAYSAWTLIDNLIVDGYHSIFNPAKFIDRKKKKIDSFLNKTDKWVKMFDDCVFDRIKLRFPKFGARLEGDVLVLIQYAVDRINWKAEDYKRIIEG